MDISIEKRQPNANLIKTLKHIKREPQLFDMNHWGRQTQCGTSACLAGTACVVNGDRPMWEFVGTTQSFDYVKARLSEDGYGYWDSSPVEVRLRGAELLGFTEDEADYIFFEYFGTFEDIIDYLTGRYHFDFSGIDWEV